MSSLNTERANNRHNVYCCILARYSPCKRKATVKVRWSIKYPSVLACTQHGLGHAFCGFAPWVRVSTKEVGK